MSLPPSLHCPPLSLHDFAAGVNSAILPADDSEDGADDNAWYSAVSLERAIGLLSLPRVVCESHPRVGGPIEVGVGRFGVYVKHNDGYRSVKGGVDVLDVDEDMAIQLVDEMIQVPMWSSTLGAEGRTMADDGYMRGGMHEQDTGSVRLVA